MTLHDIVNSVFELFAGFAILMHCRAATKAQNVAGVSVLATIFFASWGVWNLFYYPMLGQWFSFFAGIFVMYANVMWIRAQFKFNTELRAKVTAWFKARDRPANKS